MSRVFSLQQPTVNNTIGAIFIGVVGSAFLEGFTTLQMCLYYHNLIRDPLRQKAAVGILWALDIFHLALTIQAVYVYIVTNWGNMAGNEYISWSLKLQVAINVVIIVLVQSLYAWRIWIVGGYHNGLLRYIAIAIVGCGFAIGIVVVYKVYTVDRYDQLPEISWAIDASLATSSTIDSVIAFAMCYYLWKSKGNQSRLNSKISTMMQYTLSSGLLTSACSLSALVSFILIPNTLIFLGVEFLLTKLHVGSFFAMLNARERPHETDAVDEYSIHLSSSLPRPYNGLRISRPPSWLTCFK